MCVPANRLSLASLLQGPCQESKPTPALLPPPGLRQSQPRQGHSRGHEYRKLAVLRLGGHSEVTSHALAELDTEAVIWGSGQDLKGVLTPRAECRRAGGRGLRRPGKSEAFISNYFTF